MVRKQSHILPGPIKAHDALQSSEIEIENGKKKPGQGNGDT